MQIQTLITSLESHVHIFPHEKIFCDQMKDLLKKHNQHAFDNDCYNDGHFTASMFITNQERTKILLMFHKKFQKWLQF